MTGLSGRTGWERSSSRHSRSLGAGCDCCCLGDDLVAGRSQGIRVIDAVACEAATGIGFQRSPDVNVRAGERGIGLLVDPVHGGFELLVVAKGGGNGEDGLGGCDALSEGPNR